VVGCTNSSSMFSGSSGTSSTGIGTPFSSSIESSLLCTSSGDASFIASVSGTRVFIISPSAKQGSRPVVRKVTFCLTVLPAALSNQRLFRSIRISFSGRLSSQRTEGLITFLVSSVSARKARTCPTSKVNPTNLPCVSWPFCEPGCLLAHLVQHVMSQNMKCSNVLMPCVMPAATSIDGRHPRERSAA